jgi:hypothetical protein
LFKDIQAVMPSGSTDRPPHDCRTGAGASQRSVLPPRQRFVDLNGRRIRASADNLQIQ